MNDRRLRVTLDESKRLFQNLRADLRTTFDEVYKEHEGIPPQKNAAELDEVNDIWQAVEDEFRLAYEMSRFGLDVVGLQNYQDNVEIFRLNCEDINGMEQLDKSLFSQIVKEQSEVEEALQYNAMCRYSMPKNAEIQFTAHTQKMREHYEMLGKRAFMTYSTANHEPFRKSAHNTESEAIGNSLDSLEGIDYMPPEKLADVICDLSSRVKKLLLSVEVYPSPESSKLI